MAIKHKVFSGGYKFKNFAGQPERKIIDIGIPPEVVIPLIQGFGSEVQPIVKVGECVKAGQIVGIDDNIVSSPVHSSVTGIVKEIKKINYFKRDVTVVKIKSDPAADTAEWQPLEGYTQEWTKLEPAKIEQLLYLSGVTSLDREGIPTRYKSSIILPEEVENLIVHGIGSEPHNISLSILLVYLAVKEYSILLMH